MGKIDFLSFRQPEWWALEQHDDVAVLRLDGVVGSGWFTDGTTAKAMIDAVNGISSSTIELHINSPGGEVYEGFAIYNTLRTWQAAKPGRSVVAVVDGIAASIASVIVMAADVIRMPKASQLMIHNPWTVAIGGADELEKAADNLDKLRGQIAQIYADRAGGELNKMSAMMDAETFLTAEEALALGLATEVEENKKAAACTLALDVYGEKFAGDLRKITEAVGKRRLESALRDVGKSNQEAARLAAELCGAGISAKPQVDAEPATPQQYDDFIKMFKGE